MSKEVIVTQGMPSRAIDRESVASFSDYLGAQQAVDKLSDRKFAVERVQIVGTDLRMVEQVYGRLNWGRAALGGVATGAWIGLFVALLLWIIVPEIGLLGALAWGLVNGAIFGLVFGLVMYAFTGGRRDFVSRSAILPQHYDVMVESPYASEARTILGSTA
jgi:hypothetical protein